MANPLVLDLSHWQPDPIDWKALKAGGTQGVILKATQGTTYFDPTFGQRQNAALDAGLLVASYHFLQHGSVVPQMRWYLDRVKPQAGDRLVIDFEQESGKPDPTVDDLDVAVNYLMQETECEIAVYGASFLFDTVKKRFPECLNMTSLWAARYSSNKPAVPAGTWPTYSLWQFTDKATVLGIKGPVDGNIWNGDPSALGEWFYAPAYAPAPPTLAATRIDIEIDVTASVPIELYVNGTRVEA